jgi:hypothetical protein
LNNVRCESSGNYRNRKREYLKEKIKELERTVRTKISKTYIEA